MKYIIIILLLVFSSCIVESSTYSHTFFVNNTNHYIEVIGYNGDTIDQQSSFSLFHNEEKEVLTVSWGGIRKSDLSFGFFYGLNDSFAVVFDTTYRISHYKENLIGDNPNRYLYDSHRNIFNDSSYVETLKVDEKHHREWEEKYTFIEQDYLDAK
ncbi:MAG: hypothetical protein R2771_09350 [Saprospiraceae bacterium]